MPLQQFSTYDVIVDVTPGATALILGYLILPKGWISIPDLDSLSTLVILLLSGYFIGRIIHSASSYSLRFINEEKYLNKENIEEFWYIFTTSATIFGNTAIVLLIYRLYKEYSEDEETQEQRGERESVQERAEEDTERKFNNQIDSWFSGEDIDLHPSIESKVINRVESDLEEKIIPEDKNDADSANRGSIDPAAKRRYGENLLYRDNNIYNKYQMLVTFFRNMMFISTVYFIPYFVVGVVSLSTDDFDGKYLGTNIHLVAEPPIYVLISVVLLLTLIVSTLRRREFIISRNRSYIYDLDILFRDSEGNE